MFWFEREYILILTLLLVDILSSKAWAYISSKAWAYIRKSRSISNKHTRNKDEVGIIKRAEDYSQLKEKLCGDKKVLDKIQACQTKAYFKRK
jgi:hypothetical protein